MPYHIFIGFIGSSFLFAVALYFLVMVLLHFGEKQSFLTMVAFLAFCFSAFLGVIILTKTKEALNSQPLTRDIHLTVPKDSSANVQITSENNTVNIIDL